MPSPWKRRFGKALAALVLLLSATAFAGLPAARAGEQLAGPSAQVAFAQADDPIQEILRLTNEERAKYGLPALSLDPALCASALAHNQDMASHDFFSHTGSDGSTADVRIKAAGYDPLWAYGENIAAGQPTAEDAVTAWMNSEGHRANILSPYYEQIGVSFVYQPGTTYLYYWTQDFASHTEVVVEPTAEPPAPSPTPTPPQPTAVPPTVVPTRPSPVAPTATHVSPTPTGVLLEATAAPALPTPPPGVSFAPGAGLERARQVVDLLNRARTDAGRAALSFDPALARAAQAHSADMARHALFSHTGSGGSTAGQRAADAGCGPTSSLAEAIAAGQATAQEVAGAWLAAPGLRERILDPGLSLVGAGYAYSERAAYQHYWTLDLAGRGYASSTLVSPASSGRVVGLGWCLPGLPRWLAFSRVG